MSLNDKLLKAAAGDAPGGITPSEHFGVVLYEGDGKSGRSVNGGKFGAGATFGIEKSTTQATDSRITTTYYAKNVGSISGWLKKNGNTSELEYVFVTKNDTGSAHQLGINLLQEGDSDLSARVGNGSSTTNVNTSGLTLNNDVWHHYVITWNLPNSTNNVKVYVDGSLEATGSQSTGSWTGNSSRTFQLGHYTNTNTNNGFAGMQDQVRVFEKELSSSEVSTLYAETAETVTSLDPLSEDTTDTLQVLGDSSCIAAYQFENDETDLSGNYDGTGTAIQYAAGRYGQAASFNGTDSVVTGTAQNVGSSFSVSTWIYPTSYGEHNIFNLWVDSSNLFQFGLHELTNGKLTIAAKSSGSWYVYHTSSSPIPSLNQWYHIVVNRSSSDLKIYVNGTFIESANNFYSKTYNTFNIGSGKSTNTNSYFEGRIDQVRVFNKTLSASEVTTLYQENSLLASYRFEGNSNDDRNNFNGSDNDIFYEFGLNFTPDFVWIKRTDGAENNYVQDSTRGSTKQIYTNLTNAEFNETGAVSSFDTGGWTMGSYNGINNSDEEYVAWCLKANGGTTESNTDGSITSTVQANTNAGFSIVKYTGTSAAATVGHGLSTAPEMIIVKKLGAAQDWWVYHKDLNGGTNPAHYFIRLNLTDAETLNASSGGSIWNSTAPTSTVFSTGTTLQESSDYIAYCFHSVDGFSKFGSYTGNGSDDGPIVETGFEPAFLMIKNTSSTESGGADWLMYDNKRSTTNPRDKRLYASANYAEAQNDNYDLDFLSNGFQIKSGTSNYGYNNNGDTYIYIAFAADPDTEAPTVAKSFTTRTYTGTGSNRSIDGLGFSPSLLWLKGTSNTEHHYLYDTIRGSTKYLHSSNTAAQGTDSTSRLASFDDDGFSLFTDPAVNGSGQTYVAWTWKADDNEPTIFGGPAKAVYKFEDNANDVGGNYNGSVVDTVTYVTGNFNKAANFTASGTDKNEILTTLTESPSVGISLSCWVKFSTLPSGGADSTFVIKNSGTEYIHLRYEDYQSKGFSMQTKNSSSNVGAKSEMTASTGVWYHVVGTVNSGGTGKIYVNGDLKATNTGLPLPGVGSEAWRIGGFDTAQSTRGDYAIDQVRIYYDEIKQEQVDELYAETVSDNDDMSFGGAAKILISANANAGFSIVKYEGTGVTGTRVPHGLSSAPELWIGKQLTGSAINWQVLYSGFSEGDYLTLNTNAAKGNSANVTFDPTATTVKFHANQALNDSGEEYIGYAFHSVSGYSKIGTYTGTGSSQTITTGFQPDWIVTKRTDTTDNWRMYDSVRQNTQPFDEILYPNLSNAEEDNTTFVTGTTSTGFTLGSGNGSNASGGTYIYMAFKIN